MHIFLKKNWDYPSSYKSDDPAGNFVGRSKEKEKLKDEFLRKDNGSILVSGVRGVGKTSLVYQAIQEAIRRNNRIIPIIINASQLELYADRELSKSEKLPEIILKNIIRRLYAHFYTKDNLSQENKSKLAELYRKAISKDVKITHNYSSGTADTQEDKTQSEQGVTVAIDKDYLYKVIPFVVGVILILIPPIFSKYVNSIAAVILFFIPSFELKNTKKYIKNIIKQSNYIESAERVYQEDASLSNLEAELNDVLKALHQEGIKIIFIIDELDKIEEEENSVFNIIKTYKNLFTLSSALFVFITGDKVYNKLISSKKNKEASYTLFTNRLFINRPSLEELDGFIDSIIEKVEFDNSSITKDFMSVLTDENLKKFVLFKNLLCYRSRSDFFEISFIVRDFISHYDQNGFPVINLEDFGKSLDDRVQSKLQKVISQVYERNAHTVQSKWHHNDYLINSLYDFLEENYNQSFEVDQSDSEDISVLINKYLLPYLQRLRIITKIDSKNIDDKGNPANIYVYQWTGSVPGEGSVPDVPKSPSVYFKEEQDFLDVAGKYVQVVNDLDDLESERGPDVYGADYGIADTQDASALTGINSFNIFKKYEDSVDNLMDKNSPLHVSRDNLRVFIKELNQELQKLRDVSLNIVAALLRKSLSKNSIQFSEHNLVDNPQFLDDYVQIKDEITQNKIASILFSNSDGSKRVLVTKNFNPMILTNDLLQLLEEEQNLKLINIQTDLSLNYSNKSEIVVVEDVLVIGNKKIKGRIFKNKLKKKIKKAITIFQNIPLNDNYHALGPINSVVSEWLK